VRIFPTLISASAMGICNFCGMMVTIMSPMVAEKDYPLPLHILIIISIVGLFQTQFIKEQGKKE
jgi:hypothetical protein